MIILKMPYDLERVSTRQVHSATFIASMNDRGRWRIEKSRYTIPPNRAVSYDMMQWHLERNLDFIKTNTKILCHSN